jgi:histidinol-phosphate/aromatic aminotransferase/cobyric acid decarboxylase-like protein
MRGIGLEPLPSAANFLYVPLQPAREVASVLLGQGMVVRDYDDAIRVTVLDEASNARLVDALALALEQTR